MSYIVPDSTIHLIHNVKLHNDYNHTWFPSNATTQYLGITGQKKYTLNNYTYQREQRALRVGICNDDLYDINYMAYQNTRFGTKWFYAFVTKTEYVNNEVSLVYFELDVMQTWLFDVFLQRCFIERQHVIDDSIGSNLMPEPVNSQEYVENGEIFVNLSDRQAIVVAATFKYDAANSTIYDSNGGFWGNKYSGLYLNVFNSITDFVSCITIAETSGKINNIYAVYQMPDRYAVREGGSFPLYNDSTGKPVAGSTQLDGYIPKNNKLYTFPYTFMELTDGGQLVKTYRYEYFSGSRAEFHSTSSMEVDPSIIYIPQDYMGVSGDNINESFLIKGFPQCTWTSSLYEAYVGANKAQIIGDCVTTLALSLGGAATGAITMGETMSDPLSSMAMHSATNTLKSGLMMLDLWRQGNKINGVNDTSPLFNINKMGLYIHMKTIRNDIAKVIDDYFTMYGYTINKVDIPERQARQHWTYVKTRGFLANANIPQDDYEKICSIYDSGITFWTTLAEIGDYSISNPPITI